MRSGLCISFNLFLFLNIFIINRFTAFHCHSNEFHSQSLCNFFYGTWCLSVQFSDATSFQTRKVIIQTNVLFRKWSMTSWKVDIQAFKLQMIKIEKYSEKVNDFVAPLWISVCIRLWFLSEVRFPLCSVRVPRRLCVSHGSPLRVVHLAGCAAGCLWNIVNHSLNNAKITQNNSTDGDVGGNSSGMVLNSYCTTSRSLFLIEPHFGWNTVLCLIGVIGIE